MLVNKLTVSNQSANLIFPGFAEILDFTATGSEATIGVNVNGDVDKEYLIYVRNVNTAQYTLLRLNASTASYGYQYLLNTAGTISAIRGTTAYLYGSQYNCVGLAWLLTPSGFPKTMFDITPQHTSSATIGSIYLFGRVFNNTANVTSVGFSFSSGNFTSGTRIAVYARRSV